MKYTTSSSKHLANTNSLHSFQKAFYTMNHCGGTFRKRNETREGHVVGKRKITADVKKAACEADDESKGIQCLIKVSLKCLVCCY